MCTLINQKNISVLIFTLSVLIPLSGQEKAILITNPSFEDVPHHSQPPSGWYFCGPVGESPPDVHPNGYFNVTQKAQHGDTYVGMVTRDNGSWECIGQRLEQPLEKDQCYQFSIYIAQSHTYRSISRSTMDFALFTTPVKLRIWGSTQNCKKTELLAMSKVIEHENWVRYTFFLQPKQQLTHLLFEVFFKNKQDDPYNGNLLIDHAGPIIPVDCSSKKSLIEVPKILLNLPNNPDELNQFLTNHGPNIRFTQTGLQLEQHLFKDNAAQLHQGNQHLWRIAQALKQFPKQKLTIAIRGTSDLELTERKFHLTYALKAAGLSDDQFKLKTLRRTDLKKKWLWDMEDGDILMRVE